MNSNLKIVPKRKKDRIKGEWYLYFNKINGKNEERYWTGLAWRKTKEQQAKKKN